MFGISGKKLKVSVAEISSTLQTARSYASTQRKVYFVKFDTEKEEFRICYKDSTGLERLVGKVFKAPHGIDITQTSFANDQVAFKPSGRTSGGSIWIADKREKIRRISVSGLTGSVKVDKEPPE